MSNRFRKADLHLHTIATAIGDSKKREITPEELAKVLFQNKIGFAAIVNHNYFKESNYRQCIAEINKLSTEKNFCDL